jgi:eukaryotic-like serine/threonine-protein kinase
VSRSTLDARYELRERIGQGGGSTVYRALDRRLGRDVAVKVLRAQLASDPTFVERFRREARAAASLSHPNIVSVHDWAEADGSYHIVMELVRGDDLKTAIRRRGPMRESAALRIGAEIAAALESAHARGVIHRDLKPQNVLLDGDGRAKVADFGIARVSGMSQLTRTDEVFGTVHYLSPEQADGKPADERSDLYSLGVVLYEMLTGTLPFRGDTAIAVAMKHLREPPPSPRAARPEISADTESVVLRALEKDPERRFASASAMRASLDRAMEASRLRGLPALTAQLELTDRLRAAPAPVKITAPIVLLFLIWFVLGSIGAECGAYQVRRDAPAVVAHR